MFNHNPAIIQIAPFGWEGCPVCQLNDCRCVECPMCAGQRYVLEAQPDGSLIKIDCPQCKGNAYVEVN